jgi:hypothetical protein
MADKLVLRLSLNAEALNLPATLRASGAEATAQFERDRAEPGVRALLGGERPYFIELTPPIAAAALARLEAARGHSVTVVFEGRTPVKRVLEDVAGVQAAPPAGVPLDLTEGRVGAAPLWLHPDGRVSAEQGSAPSGIAARAAFVTMARWISSRRRSTFERLFPLSAFHPEAPERTERLSIEQASGLLDQVRGALREATPAGDEAARDPLGAAQTRSGALTVLSHLVATQLKDDGWRAAADAAAAEIFLLIEAEQDHEAARPALWAHAIQLLQLRGPALRTEDQERARALLQGMLRSSPPYEELIGPWRIAMCSDREFHQGECDILVKKYRWKEVDVPEDAPAPPGSYGPYRVFEAPFKTPSGDSILMFARAASPTNENREMERPYFMAVFINRHAQLGSFDMKAATVEVRQQGYKLMLNAQCAGLTTRFAISRMFPDADIYSSWDSTYFRTGSDGQVTASEGCDCFVALLEGMSEGETFTAIDKRIRKAQWSHEQAKSVPDYVQFVGPAHPLVVQRFTDLNHDGRADYYDGFLDFELKPIAEDLRSSATPRDPGVAASQVSGEAAEGLNWAVGSLNRVTQYSDIWSGLPGESELFYSFQAAGFYDQRDPPADVATGDVQQDLGRLPAVCSYEKTDAVAGGLRAEVMLHSHLAHSAKEFKRLICAAEAMWRAFDLGLLPSTGPLATPLARRGAVLLTMAGLLEFPADQNYLDGLWSMALDALQLPDISRSLVRECITDEDHQRSNYYGSRRGLAQLTGSSGKKGSLAKADAVAFEKLSSPDPLVGRARELDLP